MKRLCLQIAELKAGFELNTQVEIQGLIQMRGDVFDRTKNREGRLNIY